MEHASTQICTKIPGTGLTDINQKLFVGVCCRVGIRNYNNSSVFMLVQQFISLHHVHECKSKPG